MAVSITSSPPVTLHSLPVQRSLSTFILTSHIMEIPLVRSRQSKTSEFRAPKGLGEMWI